MKSPKKIKAQCSVNRGNEFPGLSRRGFVTGLGLSAVGVGLIRSTLALADQGDPKVEFIETSCGQEKKDAIKILVGYASCCGSTGGIAEAIGRQLCAAGARVDVKLLTDVDDPSVYDGLVVGSAIHGGEWLPEAVKFVAKHEKLMAQKKVAYFVSCLALSKITAHNQKIAEAYVHSIVPKAPAVQPLAQTAFAGAVFFEKMPKKYVPVMKLIAKKDGDYRNWEAIRAWADGLAPAMIKKG